MNGIADENRVTQIQIDRMLTSAVILSWKDLLHVTRMGLIHIEYVPGKSLRDLKMWELTGKGEWSLICEYWTSGGPSGRQGDGMTFCNDYQSEGLTDMLEVIMQHQDCFVASLGPGAGLIQVMAPTVEERLSATACMRHAYESLGLAFARLPEAPEA